MGFRILTASRKHYFSARQEQGKMVMAMRPWKNDVYIITRYYTTILCKQHTQVYKGYTFAFPKIYRAYLRIRTSFLLQRAPDFVSAPALMSKDV